jgi:hypothetical protein
MLATVASQVLIGNGLRLEGESRLSPHHLVCRVVRALVSSTIWLEKQLLVLLLLLLDCLPLVVGQHSALPVRKVHADHHEVDTNMALSDMIMVSSPNG